MYYLLVLIINGCNFQNIALSQSSDSVLLLDNHNSYNGLSQLSKIYKIKEYIII